MPRQLWLPRDTRDTWFLLLVVAAVLLPQLPYLPLWASGLSLSMLVWRAWLAWKGRPLPGRWALAGLLALAVAATAAQYRSIVGTEAGVVLLLLLLSLKTLEMRARRDAMVIFFLGFFSLLTLFLHSQSLLTGLAMLLALWGLLAALVNAHLPVGRPSLALTLRRSAQLMAWGLPLMLVLFITFPRLPPLWGLPNAQHQGRSGLSEDLTVGQIARLVLDESVAMRLRFDGDQTPAQHQLYFRGPVLSQFDGRQWRAADSWPAPPTAQPAPGAGPALGYEVTLEPHRQRWLLTLEATLAPPELSQYRLRASGDLQWLTQRPINEVLRYRAQAQLDFRYGLELSAGQRRQLSALPPGDSPRTRAWAEQLRLEHGADGQAIIAAALRRLRDGGYVYTLEPPLVTQHSADTFWFDDRQGFCEHMASAFTVLMRAAGLPARVVTGYQGGERNPVDGLWTVRQSDAHAWSEVWLEGRGWVRVDPTASVAPARTGLLQRLTPPRGLITEGVNAVVGIDTLRRLRAAWEAVNHRWNDWVLNYAQEATLRSLGLDRWSPAALSAWLAGLAGTAAAALAAWHLWRQRRRDPWQALMERARRRLQALGIPASATHGNRHLAALVDAQWGPSSRQLQRWLLQMERLRYALPGPDTPTLAALRQAYSQLSWPPAAGTSSL